MGDFVFMFYFIFLNVLSTKALHLLSLSFAIFNSWDERKGHEYHIFFGHGTYKSITKREPSEMSERHLDASVRCMYLIPTAGASGGGGLGTPSSSRGLSSPIGVARLRVCSPVKGTCGKWFMRKITRIFLEMTNHPRQPKQG